LKLGDQVVDWREETSKMSEKVDEVTKYVNTSFGQMNVEKICDGHHIDLLKFWNHVTITQQFPAF